MKTSEVVALLDLLTSRGTVAWQMDTSTDAGATLVLDTSGIDSAERLLVSRGFVVTRQQLPSHVELAHPRYGRVVLLPCVFAADGGARWYGTEPPRRIPASAFDSVVTLPRRVSVAWRVPGLDRDADADRVPRGEGDRLVPGDEAGASDGA